MDYRIDSRGVPILSKGQLEALAEEFLACYAPEALRSPRLTPLAEILETLQAQGRLRVRISVDLGTSEDGQPYLGCFDIRSCTISIALPHNDPRFPFTVAHELGHYYLHRQIQPSAISKQGHEIRDTARDLVTYRTSEKRPRSFIEYQANRFATGILVPRQTLEVGVASVQHRLGIAVNLGTIWIDQQRRSEEDYQAIVVRLAELYNVSRAVIRFRLDDLKVVKRRVHAHGMTHIGDLLREALADLFGRSWQ